MSMMTEALLRQVPELAPSARRIAEEQDDQPCLGDLLGALADLIDRHVTLATGPPFDPEGEELLTRCFQAVEALATEPDESDGPFLVGAAFLGALSAESRDQVEPLLGPATQAILDGLELGWPEEDLGICENVDGPVDELDGVDGELDAEKG